MLYVFHFVSLMSFPLLTSFALQGCDNVINNWHPSDGNKTGIDTGHCVLACSGDSSEICGGANSLLVYFNDGIS